MRTPKKKPGPPCNHAVATLRIELERRSMNLHDLSRVCGVPVETLQNVVCGNNLAWPPRDAINKALGMKIFKKPVSERYLKSVVAELHLAFPQPHA